MKPGPLRLLISAYACEPGQGSEPGVGWRWAELAAKRHEVWVMTRANNRDAIEWELRRNPMPQLHFVYFDLPRALSFWKRGRRGIYLYYLLWQIYGYFIARRLMRDITFDMAHHLTLGTHWMPSFLSLLPLPYAWGPVGGGEAVPPGFWTSLGWRGALAELIRAAVVRICEWNPWVRQTARRSSIALAKTEDSARRLRNMGACHVKVLSEAGLAEDELQELLSVPVRCKGPFRALSLARLIPFKAVGIGLRAFAEFHSRHPEAEYWIAGEGWERKRLEKLAARLRVERSVRFMGWLQRSEALSALAECDLLLHPSLHDSGGWVCLEAMAAGRPVLCLDTGGPGLQVGSGAGFKVFPSAPEACVHQLAQAMSALAGDDLMRRRFGEEGRNHVVRYYRWSEKGDLWSELASGPTLRAAVRFGLNNHAIQERAPGQDLTIRSEL